LQFSSFSRLPPQLLALVLTHIPLAERLRSMARVCSAWRAAAVMATNSISTARLPSRQYDSFKFPSVKGLSDWLQAYAAAAAGLVSLIIIIQLHLASQVPCAKATIQPWYQNSTTRR
jgi:hypothetical protein